jgi:hypothetical protein
VGDELVLAETPSGYLLTTAKPAPEGKVSLVP